MSYLRASAVIDAATEITARPPRPEFRIKFAAPTGSVDLFFPDVADLRRLVDTCLAALSAEVRPLPPLDVVGVVIPDGSS